MARASIRGHGCVGTALPVGWTWYFWAYAGLVCRVGVAWCGRAARWCEAKRRDTWSQ